MRTLFTFLMAFTALAVMFAGPFALLPVVGYIDQALGRGWGGASLAAVFAVCAATLWALARAADRRGADNEDPGAARLPDRLFCQACGLAVSADAVVCGACGSTRFGVRPLTAGEPVNAAGASALRPRSW